MVVIGRTSSAFRSPSGRHGPHDDHAGGRLGDQGQIGLRELGVQHDHQAGARQLQQPRGPIGPVSQQLRTDQIGRTLGPERQVGNSRRAEPPRRSAPAPRPYTLTRSSIRRTSPSDSVEARPDARITAEPEVPADQLPQPVERRVPIGGHVPAAVPNQRRLDPVAPVEPAVVHPAVVTHEVAIHFEIGPGTEAGPRFRRGCRC